MITRRKKGSSPGCSGLRMKVDPFARARCRINQRGFLAATRRTYVVIAVANVRGKPLRKPRGSCSSLDDTWGAFHEIAGGSALSACLRSRLFRSIPLRFSRSPFRYSLSCCCIFIGTVVAARGKTLAEERPGALVLFLRSPALRQDHSRQAGYE